jgi:hypothetical protein
MAHFTTADHAESACTESTPTEFDVILGGGDTGPTTLCRACYAPEPDWITLTEQEFLEKFPLD